MRGEAFDGSRTRHVLLVDDHAPTLAAISSILDLEQPGIEVVGVDVHPKLTRLGV